MIKDKIFVFLFLLITLPSLTLAQNTDVLSADDIIGSTNFSVVPSSPSPGEKVIVTIEGSGINFDTALLTWSVNGQNIKSGYGAKEISFVVGQIGSNSVVRLKIVADGKTYDRSITIVPGDIDLLWQGNSYIPPFYKGRSLWVMQGEFIVTAIPHGVSSNGLEYDPKSLVYKWFTDDVAYADKSGYGKNSYSFIESGLALPKEIGVEVYKDDNLIGRKYITVSPNVPLVLVYENNPLQGFLFNSEVSNNYILNKSELTLGAFPYYFTADTKDDYGLSYKWQSSGSRVSQGTSQKTFRIPEGVSGKSLIYTEINNKEKIGQGANKDFLVQFSDANAL
jgi:hypothetical protein